MSVMPRSSQRSLICRIDLCKSQRPGGVEDIETYWWIWPFLAILIAYIHVLYVNIRESLGHDEACDTVAIVPGNIVEGCAINGEPSCILEGGHVTLPRWHIAFAEWHAALAGWQVTHAELAGWHAALSEFHLAFSE